MFFAGPIFNVLVGTGIPFTIHLLSSDEHLLDLKKDKESDISFLFLGLSLVMTLITVPCNDYFLSRPIAALLLGIYFAFVSLLVFIEIGVLPAF